MLGVGWLGGEFGDRGGDLLGWLSMARCGAGTVRVAATGRASSISCCAAGGTQRSAAVYPSRVARAGSVVSLPCAGRSGAATWWPSPRSSRAASSHALASDQAPWTKT